MERELPEVQAGLRKGRGTRDPIANILWIKEKERKFQKKKKKPTSASLTMLKPGLCGSQQTVENSSRDGNTRSLHISPKKLVCRSRSKLEPDMEQWTGSKLGKDYIKPVYCHLAYLTYMQSTS